jgi:hypothetical protein
MIDYTTYDPENDADENKGHLCNSLNATLGALRRIRSISDAEFAIVRVDFLERTADYLERAQATINYLREELTIK